MIRNWRYGALVAVTILTLAASNGCCCRTRKGIVLRGDWSLELNRVPHMQSNGPSYSGDCCAPACGVPCGCADGCRHGGGMSGDYEVLDGSGYPGGAGGSARQGLRGGAPFCWAGRAKRQLACGMREITVSLASFMASALWIETRRTLIRWSMSTGFDT